MCPWCFISPVCPCRRGAAPHAFWLPVAREIVAAARRLSIRAASQLGVGVVNTLVAELVLKRPETVLPRLVNPETSVPTLL